MLNTMPNQSRVSAPTITNLLTAGTVPNMTGKPVISAPISDTNGFLSISLAAHTQASTSAGIVYSTQMQNQPLSGPPVPAEPYPGSLTPTPSQAAPTLSMLLESKHKDSPTKLNAGGTLDAGHKHEPHADLSTAELAIKDEDQQLMDAFSDLIPDDIDVLAGMILDDLISEEQDAAVSSVAECLENEAMAAANSLGGDEAGAGMACAAAGLMGLDDIKSEPSNVHENACDGMEFTHGAAAVDETKPEPDAVDVKQFQPKDEDSSDLSNDTPLSELIKQEASAKQQRLLQEQQQQFQLEQQRHDGDTQEQSQLMQDTEPAAQLPPEVDEQQPQLPAEQQAQAEQTDGERLQQDDQGLSDAEQGLPLDAHDIEPLGERSEPADLDGNDIQQSEGHGVVGDDAQGPVEAAGCTDPVESSVDPVASVGQNPGAKESADAEESSNGPDGASLEPATAVDPMDFLASDSNDTDAAPLRPSADTANVQPPDDGAKVALSDDVLTEPMTVAGEQLEPEIDEPLDALDSAELSNDAMDSVTVDVTKNHGSDVNGTAVDNAAEASAGESAAKGDDQPADGEAANATGAVDEVIAPSATDAKNDDILTDDEGDGANDGDEAMQEASEATAEMAVNEPEAEPASAGSETVDEVMGEDAAAKDEGNGHTGGLEGPVDGGVNGDEKDGNETKRTGADEALVEHDDQKHVERYLNWPVFHILLVSTNCHKVTFPH